MTHLSTELVLKDLVPRHLGTDAQIHLQSLYCTEKLSSQSRHSMMVQTPPPTALAAPSISVSCS